jgi:dihydroflavonol-4-reductase
VRENQAVRVYVTGGGRGFIGGHVVRALRARRYEVRDEWVDLRDADGLRGAIAGCEVVFNVAALYSFDAPSAELEAVNVGGTRNVLDACLAAGVRRLVHTSSSTTCGPVPGRVATEADEPPEWELVVPYKRTKLESERLVLAAAADGLDAVVVNPTTPVGEGDTAPTPTGRMVQGVASGRYRAYVGTAGVNLVDVRDVARGHLLALDRGRRGERYLLGGENLPLRDAFARIAQAAGRPRPRIRVPYAAVRAGAALGMVNRNEALLARVPEYFSSAKAQSELGYEPSPIDDALRRAVSEHS